MNEVHIPLTTPQLPHQKLVRQPGGSNSVFLDPISFTDSAVRSEDPDCEVNWLTKVGVCCISAPPGLRVRCRSSTAFLIQAVCDQKMLQQRNTHVALTWQHPGNSNQPDSGNLRHSRRTTSEKCPITTRPNPGQRLFPEPAQNSVSSLDVGESPAFPRLLLPNRRFPLL